MASAPGALPLVGHVVPLVRDKQAFLNGLPAHGDLVWVHIGPWKALVVTSAELSRQVLRDDRTFDKGGHLYERIRETGGNGLVSCAHSDHRRQRRLVQPSFHNERLPGYLRVVKRQVDDVLGGWRAGDVVDVLTEMQTITARAMLPGGLPPAVLEEMFEAMNVILAGVAWRSMMPRGLDKLPTPANLRYRRAQQRLRRIVTGVIAGHRASDTDHDDLLSGLLAACRPGEVSDGEIHDQVVTFLLAGTETTANVVSWALHLVAQDPGIEQRLRSEADSVLGGGDVTPDDLSQLPLARNVILETLRMYPPVPLLTRIVTENTELGGHFLPAGTTIAYSPYVVQHRAEHFPDPERFVPDRWDNGKETLRPPHRAGFLAFGGGARQCIGDTFGLAEATLMLSAVTHRWSMRSLPGSRVRPAMSLVLSPRALRMRVRTALRTTGAPS